MRHGQPAARRADVVSGGGVERGSAGCQRVVVFYCHEVDPLFGGQRMFSANTYRIRLATAADADTIQGWGGAPLTGQVLIGEIAGAPAAAMSLSDGQTASDGSAGTDHLLANMRMRAVSMVAHAAAPSLRDRRWRGCRCGIARSRPMCRLRAPRTSASWSPRSTHAFRIGFARGPGAAPGPFRCSRRGVSQSR